MNEFFLITWEESGDETHFILLPMSEFTTVDTIKNKLSSREIPMAAIDKTLHIIRKKSVMDFFMQTYCTENWPFSEYIIKKIISIPEFGW